MPHTESKYTRDTLFWQAYLLFSFAIQLFQGSVSQIHDKKYCDNYKKNQYKKWNFLLFLEACRHIWIWNTVYCAKVPLIYFCVKVNPCFLHQNLRCKRVLSWFVFFARVYSKSFKSFFEFQPLSRESAFFWKLEIFPRNFDIYMQQQGKKWDQITALLAGEELLPNLI